MSFEKAGVVEFFRPVFYLKCGDRIYVYRNYEGYLECCSDDNWLASSCTFGSEAEAWLESEIIIPVCFPKTGKYAVETVKVERVTVTTEIEEMR